MQSSPKRSTLEEACRFLGIMVSSTDSVPIIRMKVLEKVTGFGVIPHKVYSAKYLQEF